MTRLLSILLITQLVCGFGFFRPRHVNNGRYTQMAGFSESLWAVGSPATGGTHLTAESNQYFARCSGWSEYCRVWISGANGTWFVIQARPTDTNSVRFVAETSFVAAVGTNQPPAVFNLEEGDQCSFYLPGALDVIRITAGGPAAGIPVRFTNSHMASGTWVWPSSAGGLALNGGLWGKGPALAVLGDSNPGSPPGYAPFLNAQQIGGMSSNAWSWMLRNRHDYRSHVKNYCVGGTVVQFVRDTEMQVSTNDRPMVVLLQTGGNSIAAATNTWAEIAEVFLTIRRAHPGPFYFLSILPGQAYDDTQALTRRTWNTNLLNLAMANGAFFIPLDDVVGTNRVSTGQLDDYKPEYNLDNSHLTPPGQWAVVAKIANALTLHLK